MYLERVAKLRNLLRAVDESVDLSAFPRDQAQTFQKTIYFLGELGADLHYSFGWYVHGPFSSTATEDSFDLATFERYLTLLPRGATGEAGKLTETDRGAVAKFVALREDAAARLKSLSPEKRLELVASIHYYAMHGYPHFSVSEAKRRFVEAKTDFTSNEVDAALNVLRRHGLLPQQA